MSGVNLDKHGQRAINEHRVHSRGLELPVILSVVKLGKLEVVALSAIKHLTALDNTRRDEGAGRPAAGLCHLGGMERRVIHKNGHFEAVGIGFLAFPFLQCGQR